VPCRASIERRVVDVLHEMGIVAEITH
jgi:hypothetical protein